MVSILKILLKSINFILKGVCHLVSMMSAVANPLLYGFFNQVLYTKPLKKGGESFKRRLKLFLQLIFKRQTFSIFETRLKPR